MRSMGSLLTFLVISWIGLGYSLSDNINTHQALAQVQQQVAQAVNDKKAAQDQLAQAIAKLNTLQQQNNQLAQQSQALQAQLTQVQGENQGLKSQNADMQNQLDQMKKVDTLVGDLMGFPFQSLMLAIFVPILPVSLVTGYVVYQHKRSRGGRNHNKDNKSKRIMSVNITENEMRQIVKMRRGKE